MNVVYDISILGAAHHSPKYRAGISRVIENLLEKLVAHDACRVSLSAVDNPVFLVGAVRYRAAHPHLRDSALCFTDNALMNLVLRSAERIYPAETATRLAKIGRRIESFLLNRLTPLCRSLDHRVMDHADIFHSTFSALPGFVRGGRRLRRFITIYDIMPILLPQYFPAATPRIMGRILKSIRRDDWVLAISQSTKNDFCNHLHFDPSRVFVTRLAASGMFYRSADSAGDAHIRRTYNIPEGAYALSLCTFEPRKNIDHVVRCFIRTVKEQHISDLNLVLVGAKGWDYDRIFAELSRDAEMRRRIVVTGYVPDEHLAAVYSGALMFIYPSFYEGFGLPPLEAMQCGVPVITSNTSSLPEVVGDAGIMVDPRDSDALCQGIFDLYRKPSLRAEIARRSLERAKTFSWDACAEETIAAYLTALQTSP